MKPSQMPAVANLVETESNHTELHHIVQFYQNDEYLYDVVSGFLRDGLRAGEPLVVLATDQHLNGFTSRLGLHGIDIGRACRSGDLTLLNAREMLNGFMEAGLPNENRFQSTIGRVIETAIQSRGNTSVRAYGEMVDLLWRDGNPIGALRVEELWNELARKYSFSLLCAYAMGNFFKEAHAAGFRQICDRHSHVLPPRTTA